tara:strand:+ start:2871 stop:3818 length:948 start_codon:yes stop_codon:yes gene_type:complete
MITAYILHENQFMSKELTTKDQIPDKTLWLDVFDPDEDERQWLSSYFVEDVPEEEDRNELEASARFYSDRDGLHINSLFPQRIGTTFNAINLSFTLRSDLMITIREDDLGLIRLMRNYLRTGYINVKSPYALFFEFFSIKVDYLSDLIEDVYTVLENVGPEVINAAELDNIFKQITIQEDTNGKIRLSLLDTQRSLRYITRYHRHQLTDENVKDLQEIMTDIDSLMPHSQFLFDKLNFLLESTIGFNGLRQNKIIKIFSVAAVVFLPPTLIASIYGMNFKYMPELDWYIGYPIALGLMVTSAASTYFFFKQKGWL